MEQPSASKVTVVTPRYGTSRPFAARKVRKRGVVVCISCEGKLWRNHSSVTVVTSLPVSTTALTSLPSILIDTVGHGPVSPAISKGTPAAWALTTGESSFPDHMMREMTRIRREVPWDRAWSGDASRPGGRTAVRWASRKGAGQHRTVKL